MAPIQEDSKFNLSISDIYVAITHIFSILQMGKQRAKVD